ncbi:hypothetical protein BHE74_00044852 [Ensete ventricosum]|nr:hypothetical protein BHE74_00044852 [Ensete ventricosum]
MQTWSPNKESNATYHIKAALSCTEVKIHRHSNPSSSRPSSSFVLSLERYRERICFSLKRWSMESCDAALPSLLLFRALSRTLPGAHLLLSETLEHGILRRCAPVHVDRAPPPADVPALYRRGLLPQPLSSGYASRATNALLWVCLISVTSLLCGRLARLVRLWVQGSRIPGPPSNPFLARSKLIPGCGSLGSLTGGFSLVARGRLFSLRGETERLPCGERDRGDVVEPLSSVTSPGPHEKYEDFQKSAFHSEPKRMAAFLPFGYGIRACIGEKFPTLGISTLIAFLLQNYEVMIFISYS